MYVRDSQGGHTSISLILIHMIKASFLPNSVPLSHFAQFLHLSAGLQGGGGGGHTSISLILIHMVKASFLPNSVPLSHLAQFLHVSAGLPGGAHMHFFDLNLHDKSFISTKFRTFITFSTIFICICGTPGGGGAHKHFFDRDARPRTNFNYPKNRMPLNSNPKK